MGDPFLFFLSLRTWWQISSDATSLVLYRRKEKEFFFFLSFFYFSIKKAFTSWRENWKTKRKGKKENPGAFLNFVSHWKKNSNLLTGPYRYLFGRLSPSDLIGKFPPSHRASKDINWRGNIFSHFGKPKVVAKSLTRKYVLTFFRDMR